MVRATLFLALGSAASAAKLTGFSSNPSTQKNLLPIGLSNEALNLGLQGVCGNFQKVCDTNFCIDTLTTCCGDGNGAFCKSGTTCVENGCCPIGQRCTGPPTCDDDDEKLCGIFCIPKDANCCSNSQGTFCDAGSSCLSSGCAGGEDFRGGSGGGSGGGSSGDSDDDDSSSGGSSGGGSSGGSGGSGGSACFDFQERCGDGCMPEGATCCPNGRQYCLSHQFCSDDGICTRRDGKDGGSTGWNDDDDDDDLNLPSISRPLGSITSTTTTSTTSTNIFDSNPLPTGLVSGGPDDDDTQSSGGGGSSGDDNDQNTDGAMVHGPSVFAAIVALIPLLL